MIDYATIYTKIWHNKSFKKLSKDGKILFLYMLTNPNCNLIGIYEFDKDICSFYISIEPHNIENAFKEVCDKMNVYYDEQTSYIFIKNKFHYCPNKNSPKIKDHIIKQLSLLKNENKFKEIFLKEYSEFFRELSKKSSLDDEYCKLKKLYPSNNLQIKNLLLNQGYVEAEIDKLINKK